MSQVQALQPVLDFLDENRIAWIPFAEHLEGRPDMTIDEVWAAAKAAVGDPSLRQREHWLL